MRRHVGWLAKLSLWSFRVIKACCFAICSARLSMLSSWAMDFACKSGNDVGGVFVSFLVGGCDAVP